jgi:FkbM family methyltransferase
VEQKLRIKTSYFPWKTVGAMLVAAVALATTWSYVVSGGAMGWMLLRGEPLECDARGALLSAKAGVDEAVEADRVRRAIRVVKQGTDGLWLHDTPNGPVWFPGDGSGAIALEMAEQRRDIYSQRGVGVRAGDIVMDVGANVGLFARTALNAGAEKVIAIEPVPANVECLRRNLKSEIDMGRVVVVAKGAWNKDDLLEMNVYPDNMPANTFVGNRDEPGLKVELPLTTLDKIAAELGLARVDFIKMDIEGAERQAVRGAAAVIRQYKPRMALCVHHLPDDPVVIPREVLALRADYSRACGNCLFAAGQISPQVFFFR